MKAVLYLRVSTEDQSTENQLPQLTAFCQQRGMEIIEVYQEEVSAWKAGRQRELAEMLKAASRREFDVVVVWALDRLTREGIATILNYVNTLKRYNVRVLSLQEPWTEFPNDMTELFYSITAWVARFESSIKSERVKAALAKRKAEGKPLGRIAGAKDKKKRKRTGYVNRYADRRV